MVLPPRLRYQLIRLKALNRPALWGLLAGLGLLAVAGQQYRQHPEWLGQFELDSENSPRSDVDTALSPEDQAEIAEIDNLSLLLNQMQPVTTEAIEPPAPPEGIQPIEDTGLALPEAESSSLLTSVPALTTEGALANYRERNQFNGGRGAATTAPGGPSASQPSTLSNPAGGSRSASVSPSSSTAPTTALPTSPLERALLEQQTTRSATDETTSAASEQRQTTATDTTEPASLSTNSGLTPPPWVVEGSIPGVNQSFIRTTPQMSPPPGTTGYTRPPSLQLSQPATGQSISTPSLPGAAPLDLDLSGSRTSPLQPGTGLPTAGQAPLPTTGSNYIQPQELPQPEPFTVPRPPGSYTGGGYIYTFSDPNGPTE